MRDWSTGAVARGLGVSRRVMCLHDGEIIFQNCGAVQMPHVLDDRVHHTRILSIQRVEVVDKLLCRNKSVSGGIAPPDGP